MDFQNRVGHFCFSRIQLALRHFSWHRRSVICSWLISPIHNFHIFGPVPKRFQKTQKGIFTRSERFYLKLSVGRSVLRWHPVICSWLMPFCQFLHHQPFNHPLIQIGANAQIRLCLIEMSFILSSWHISNHNPEAIIWGLHVGNKVSFGLIWCPGDKSL